MIIIDTTVWVDYFRGTRNPETEWLDREVGKTRLGLTDLILYETLQGFRSDHEFSQARTELLKFQLFDMAGEQLAIAAAQNFRRLREKGRTVKIIACLIATFCIEQGHSLLHRHSDFEHFEKLLGLSVIHL